jgi:hypothetical protein
MHLRWRLWRRGFMLREQRANGAKLPGSRAYMIVDTESKRILADNLSLEAAERWVDDGAGSATRS